MEYIYNTETRTLHIKGYCRHTKGVLSDHYLHFASEHEALAYDGRAVGLCKLCEKTRIEKLRKKD